MPIDFTRSCDTLLLRSVLANIMRFTLRFLLVEFTTENAPSSAVLVGSIPHALGFFDACILLEVVHCAMFDKTLFLGRDPLAQWRFHAILLVAIIHRAIHMNTNLRSSDVVAVLLLRALIRMSVGQSAKELVPCVRLLMENVLVPARCDINIWCCYAAAMALMSINQRSNLLTRSTCFGAEPLYLTVLANSFCLLDLAIVCAQGVSAGSARERSAKLDVGWLVFLAQTVSRILLFSR